MNQEHAIIIKIIDEMTSYLFHLGAKNSDINCKEEEDCYILTFKCDYDPSKIKLIYRMTKYLHMERQAEMEGYYWELAGQYKNATELTLVGMMTDEAKIYYDNERVEILLIRIKQK
jgi:hypothetical protein